MELSWVPVDEKQRGTCSEHEGGPRTNEARGGMCKAATRPPAGPGGHAAPRPRMP